MCGAPRRSRRAFLPPSTYGDLFMHVAVTRFLCAVTPLIFAAALVAAEPARVGDPYPLSVDATTGEALGDQPVTIEHDGREFRFANEANAEAFRADPAKHIAAIDKRMIEDQLPHYPLDKCVVSGEALLAMGQPEDVIVRNRLVRFCCADCRESVQKDPAEAFAKLDAAVIEKQKAQYPLKTCPVSGEALGGMGEPHDVVIAHRLVRLCCEGCLSDARAKAAGIVSRIDAGTKPAGEEPSAPTHGDHSHSHSHGHGM